MPRQPRFFVPEQPAHVIQRGNNRCAIFNTDDDRFVFRDCFTDACHHHDCQVHAYVLMTNHVHFLMTPKHERGIARVMQTVGRRYVLYFNRKHGRTGTLWEGRYRATSIDTERYLFTCYRYIELNPVRAGLVAHPRLYRWSSYGANALGQRDPLVTPHDRLAALGDSNERRQVAYRALFDEAVDEEAIVRIRRATHSSAPGVRPHSDPGSDPTLTPL